VDSSVGGKVAVNHPLCKNSIGAFYQPWAVVADTDYLYTLSRREIICGLAEVIKYGVIWDPKFFTFLEKNLEKIISLDRKALTHAINVSCRIKAAVVSRDELENGLRAIINFGHTIGHAIETVAGYGTVNHGEAVILGMATVGNLAVRWKYWPEKDNRRLLDLIKRLGMIPHPQVSSTKIFQAMRLDKKNIGGSIRMVVPVRIGKVKVVKVPETEKLLRYPNT
jgi:3-dehydroquinate synthase